MAVAEILMTKKECFTIYEDGHITMTRGKFKPSKPLLHDVCERPQKPEKGPWDFVQHNI